MKSRCLFSHNRLGGYFFMWNVDLHKDFYKGNKLILLPFFIISIFLVVSACAQQKQIADEVIQRLTMQLALSPKQVSVIRPIIVDNIAKRQVLLNGVTDKNIMKAKISQSVWAETQEIDQYLDQSQAKKLNDLTQQELEKHGTR